MSGRKVREKTWVHWLRLCFLILSLSANFLDILRRAANRRSAFESRQRRKILIDDLQETVQMLSKENAAIRKDADMLRQERDTVIRENHQLRLQQQVGSSLPGVQSGGTMSVFNNSNISHQRCANQGPIGGLVASQHPTMHSNVWLPGNQIPTGLSHPCATNQREYLRGPSHDPFAPNEIGNFGPRLHGLTGIQDQHINEFISSRSHQTGIQRFPRPHTDAETLLNGQMMQLRELSRKYSPSHETHNKL